MVNEGSYDIERIISEGLRPVRALYWSAIQQIAHQLVQEFPGDVLKSLAASDRLDELVRESDWFYMPLQAWVTHLVTDNAGAYWSYIDKHKTEKPKAIVNEVVKTALPTLFCVFLINSLVGIFFL